MKRDIIKIDDEKCNGCGLCVPNCHEGVLRIIAGKVRLVSDLMCDGLGACIGYCPEGAITIESREAEPYDEVKVMEIMVSKGFNDVKKAVHAKENTNSDSGCNGGCQGSKTVVFDPAEIKLANQQNSNGSIKSELRQWPVQLHLINPGASYFNGSDLLVASDCSAFTLGDFHQNWLKNKSLVIACPKLDQGKEAYLQKFISLIDNAKVNTITVLIMEVPCCGGLLQLVEMAISRSTRKVPVKCVTVSIKGEVLNEEWV